MISKLTTLLSVLHISRCSIVIDSEKQKGIYVSEFCPSMKYCAEGAHVMCMYYDPKQMYGPRCSNPRNMTITPDLVNHLLDITNAIRSKIATGKEKGRDNVQLPKGYGIFRLKWDNELATFAQVLANQCILRHDLCRATKRFPDPGQTAGMMRLTVPDWKPIYKQSNNTALDVPGLNPEKITYFVTQILKSWYSQKTSVTGAMIDNYPDWSLNPTVPGRVYLELVHGASTHMGCGMTAYTEYNYFQRQPINGKPGGINYNTVLLICNFSSRPKIGEQAYLTARPPYSSLCGCPEGTQEDSDCLCVEAVVKQSKDTKLSVNAQAPPDTCSDPDGNCEQTLVVLPIFTVEDAPPEKLKHIEEPSPSFPMNRLYNTSNAIQRTQSMKIYDFFDETANEHQSVKDPATHHLNTAIMTPNPESTKLLVPSMKPDLVIPYAEQMEIQKQIESRENRLPENCRKSTKLIPANRKSSIFSKVTSFKLPNRQKSYSQDEPIKYDVKPRKDFSNIQRVVNEYLNQRDGKLGNSRLEIVSNKREGILKSPYISTTQIQGNKEIILNKTEDKIMDFNQVLKEKDNTSTVDNARHYDVKLNENDNKLLNLLDNLEQEVKHIELDGDEKEIFDAKIKKIYDSVVGLPSALSFTKTPSYKNNQQSLLYPPSVDRAHNSLESDIRTSKSYLDHNTNHFIEDDYRTRFQSDGLENKNFDKINIENNINRIKNYELFDQHYKENTKRGRNIGYEDMDITNNKFNNENDMFENNPKLFTDIKHKYNSIVHNYGLSKLEQNYDGEADMLAYKYRHNFNHKHDNVDGRKYTNIPAPRNQNSISKYETEARIFDNYRERTPRIGNSGLDKTYMRNDEDIRRYDLRNRNERVNLHKTSLDHDDILSVERRKYYQEKIDNLEKKLRNTHSYHRRETEDNANSRKLRRMRPNMVDTPKSKTQGDDFYVPDRAKFLHGF